MFLHIRVNDRKPISLSIIVMSYETTCWLMDLFKVWIKPFQRFLFASSHEEVFGSSHEELARRR